MFQVILQTETLTSMGLNIIKYQTQRNMANEIYICYNLGSNNLPGLVSAEVENKTQSPVS